MNVTDHLSTFGKARNTHRKQADMRMEVLAKTQLDNDGPGCLSNASKRAFKRAHDHHTSGWLTVVPSRSHGLALTANEFWDGLALRFGWEPVSASPTCTGCGKPLTMEHAQNCEVGSMRIQRHDYLKLLLASLLKVATTSNSVLLEQPIVLPDRPRSNRTNAANTQPHNAAGAPRLPIASSRDPRIDIRAKNLRGIGETDDLDVRLTHLDSLSYVRSTKTVEQLFEDHHIKPKKDMYEEGCRLLRHRFVPFVVSTDGVLSEPAKDIVQLLATKTAEKWGMEGPGQKSVVMALIRAKIGAAIVRGASWCIRGRG